MDMKLVFDSVLLKNWPGPRFGGDYRELNQATDFDRLKIVELFGKCIIKAAGSRQKETFHTTTDFTLPGVLSLNS